MPGNDVAITWFVENVPTMHCDYELSRLKEETTDRAWTENDLRDIWALSAALVYADGHAWPTAASPPATAPSCWTTSDNSLTSSSRPRQHSLRHEHQAIERGCS